MLVRHASQVFESNSPARSGVTAEYPCSVAHPSVPSASPVGSFQMRQKNRRPAGDFCSSNRSSPDSALRADLS